MSLLLGGGQPGAFSPAASLLLASATANGILSHGDSAGCRIERGATVVVPLDGQHGAALGHHDASLARRTLGCRHLDAISDLGHRSAGQRGCLDSAGLAEQFAVAVGAALER